MREFDMQVKVIQDFERQNLMSTEEGEVKKGEEHKYLQMVNAKIEQDLINIREVFKVVPIDNDKTA
jgi:hypothetical protein